MKLDDEMRAKVRAVLAEFDPEWAATMSTCDEQLLLAGYRLALERAAHECEEVASSYARRLDDGAFNDKWKAATKCASAIRALGSEHE